MVQTIKTFNKYRYLLFSFVGKDIKLKYRRSILGVLWSVLNPLLMMVVITTVFSTLFRFNVPNFHLYYLTGALIYNFISEATSGSLQSVTGAAALLKKVYIPKYLFPVEKCLFAFVNMGFTLVAVVVVLVLTPGIEIFPTMFLFPLPLLMALVFSVGLSLLLSSLTVFFRDIIHLYGVFLMAWMYATPIIYPLDASMPRILHVIMKFNPMYYYVTYFRDVVLNGVIPSLAFRLAGWGFAFLMLGLGVAVFKKTQDRFIMHM